MRIALAADAAQFVILAKTSREKDTACWIYLPRKCGTQVPVNGHRFVVAA